MRANESTMILEGNLVLVPYRKEHVTKYHQWMLDVELQELTASEPLSLEEEYEMQRKWQTDEDKLTFIICHRESETAEAGNGDHPVTMIGDINLFFKGVPNEGDFEVEVEIMIAEPHFRGQGLGLLALQLVLSYATSPSSPAPLPVSPSVFVARIGESNVRSRQLFEKLGFVMTKRVEVFHEIELRFRGSTEQWIKGTVKPYIDSKYS